MRWVRGRMLAIALMVFMGTYTAPGSAAQASFVGDFETGNADQWPNCQNVVIVSGPCSEFPNDTYSMRVEAAPVRQGRFAARFEVRQGDQPRGICCGDRAEVSGENATVTNEGDDRWYQWSTMFGEGFPAAQGWSVISQWHANAGGSPPLAFSAGPTNVAAGRWGIVVVTYNDVDAEGPVFTPWSAPVVPGVWNDIKVHVKWSTSDAVGFIEFWLNGVPQTFTAEPCAGETRCMVRTLMPGGNGAYFKQGYYRDPDITEPGVIYHDGFSMANSEVGLAPL